MFWSHIVGYSRYLDSKPALYSSTSLISNGTELLRSTLTYLSFDSKSRSETVRNLSLFMASWCKILEGTSNFSLRIDLTAES